MTDLKKVCARYVGAPRAYRGQTPAGWDCWGLVRWIGVHDLGFDWPDYDEAYAGCVNGDDAATAAAVARYLGGWRKVDAPRPGCVACFDRRGTRRVGDPRIFHVGLIVSASDMIHVLETTGTVIEPFDGFVWGRYFAGAWEFVHA